MVGPSHIAGISPNGITTIASHDAVRYGRIVATRLPGRGTLGDDEPPSMMLAQYPLCTNQGYKDDTIEQSMTTTMDIVKACRSLRASYNINNKVSTHFFIKASAEKAAIATSQNDDIVTLGKA